MCGTRRESAALPPTKLALSSHHYLLFLSLAPTRACGARWRLDACDPDRCHDRHAAPHRWQAEPKSRLAFVAHTVPCAIDLRKPATRFVRAAHRQADVRCRRRLAFQRRNAAFRRSTWISGRAVLAVSPTSRSYVGLASLKLRGKPPEPAASTGTPSEALFEALGQSACPPRSCGNQDARSSLPEERVSEPPVRR